MRTLYSLDPPNHGLFFTLSGIVYLPNECFFIEDIGSNPTISNPEGAAINIYVCSSK